MRSGAKLAGLALALLLAQALVIAVLPESLRPDLVLVFALAMGLRAGGTGGLLLAFACGLAVDVLSAAPLGLFALLRGTACAATRALDRALYLRAPGPWAIYVLVYALVDGLVMALCLRWFAEDAALAWTAVLLRAPGTCLATALVATPLLSVFRRIDIDPARDGGWAFLPPPRSRARS